MVEGGSWPHDAGGDEVRGDYARFEVAVEEVATFLTRPCRVGQGAVGGIYPNVPVRDEDSF